jgi:hypothetical protein
MELSMTYLWACLILFSSLSFAGPSEEVRATREYEALIHVGYDYRLDSTQGSIGKHLDKDNVISFKAGSGSDSAHRQFSAAFQFKHFEGDSFYVAPELYYVNYFNSNDDDYYDLDPGHFSAAGLGVRIGNQWHLKHFTLGFDWIGIGRNIVYWTNTYEEKYDYTITLLNMSLGYSF